jgi:hypothetical protein
LNFQFVKDLDTEDFRRFTGVKRITFDMMIEIIIFEETKIRKRGGPKHKLSVEDRLLITLEYLREYRTYFHIAKSRNISESACFRCIRSIEDILIKCKKFSLPGKKELLKTDHKFEIILADVTESPIQRPQKKQKKILFWEEEKTHTEITSHRG